MCPPGHASSRDPFTGRHIGRPLQILLQHPSTSGQWAGTEPRPYSRRMPNAGSRSTGPSSTSSPASQNARNDSRHQSLHLPSPVPTSFVPESPVTPGWFPKEGPQPFLWSFQGGRQGGNSKSPLNFSSGVWGMYSFNLERIHPQMPPSILGTPRPVGQLPRRGVGDAASCRMSRRGRTLHIPPPGIQKSRPFGRLFVSHRGRCWGLMGICASQCLLLM